MNDCQNCELASFATKQNKLNHETDKFEREALQIFKLQREQIEDLKHEIEILKELVLCQKRINRN